MNTMANFSLWDFEEDTGPDEIYIGDEEHPGLRDAQFDYRIEPGDSRWKVSVFTRFTPDWSYKKELIWQGHIGDDYP